MGVYDTGMYRIRVYLRIHTKLDTSGDASDTTTAGFPPAGSIQYLAGKWIYFRVVKQLVLIRPSESQVDQPKNIRFVPDTTLNTVLKILNRRSILRSIGDQKDKMIEGEGPLRVVLRNKEGDEYAILFQSYGSNWNSFNEFEVGKVASNCKSVKRSLFETFFTESGVRLGMTMDSLEAIKGNHFVKAVANGEIVLRYNLSDSSKDNYRNILARYNMPEYEAEYYFVNFRLIKFRYGFPNP